MKKKYITILMLFLMGFNAHSQILISALFGDKLNSDGLEFGLEGGFNWSDISDLQADKSLSSFNLGLYFDIRLKDQWNLYTGVLVKGKLGASGLTQDDLSFLQIEPYEEEGTYSQAVNYFVVPIFIKYNFKNRMYLEGGPQFGLMHKAFVLFESDVNDTNIRIKEQNADKINRLDAGFTVGTGYKLMKDNGMTLGIKYYQGIANVYKGVSGTHNSSLFLKFNIPIGASNKESKTKDE